MAKYDWNTFRNYVAFLAGEMASGTTHPHHDSEWISWYHDAFLPWDHYLNNIVLFYHDSPITRSHFMDPTDRAIKGFYCSSMLHGMETWPMTSAALHRLCRNDRAMIHWICGVKPLDDPSMDELHAKLGICDLAILVRECRLRWFGHVMSSNGEINRVRSRPVPGRKGPGRPKKTWEECMKQDLKVCGLSEAGTQDRLSWRSSVKNSRQEPTPSNGSLAQSMAAPPARRVLGMRTRSLTKLDLIDWLIDWLMRRSSITFPQTHIFFVPNI